MSLIVRKIQWRRPIVTRQRTYAPAGGTLFFLSVGGSITPAGAVAKLANKILLAAFTPTGADQLLVSLHLVGASQPVGTVTRFVTRLLAGALTPVGALVAALVTGIQLLYPVIARLVHAGIRWRLR